MTGAPTNDRDDAWWDGQFADRARPCPFFVDSPDENLAGWLDEGLLPPGRALELGCGNGRNAVHLAILGHVVDAVDFSASAVAWARERAAAADVSIHVQHCSIFDAELADGQYDLVYDSGCFHHLMPDERAAYLALVTRALAPGGRFGLVCFRPEGGSGYSDADALERGSTGGGLSYSAEQLRALWDRPPFALDVLRPMREPGPDEPAFGKEFLWALLATKRGGHR